MNMLSVHDGSFKHLNEEKEQYMNLRRILRCFLMTLSIQMVFHSICFSTNRQN